MNREFQPDKSRTLSRNCYCGDNSTPFELMHFDVPDEAITETDIGNVLNNFVGELSRRFKSEVQQGSIDGMAE